ncbi:MAG: efflux RND transporter periplasmic adaptor subunit [Verrucomicrobia bacterium]|nr:efflux RND transporter periplasmic adaptor subunit [Verrucomicrobiota bacterium]
MKISLSRFAVTTVVMAALISVLSSCKKEAPEAGPRPPVPVTFGTVIQKDMPNHKEWIGNLQGTVTSLVKPNVSGNIIQRYYTEGSVVKQGEPLFQIDPAPFQADIDRAKADLATAIAQETKVQQDFVRAQSLLAGKVISVQEFQNQQQNYQAMVAQVAGKQAAVQSAQVNLDFTKIVAPIDGMAGLANYEVGTYVGPTSQQPLTTIVAIDPIKVVFQVGQDDYLSLIAGSLKNPSTAAEQRKEDREAGMQMVLSDGTLYPQKGTFRAVNNQISTQTGSITVEGNFPNPGTLLRPGLFARVQATVGVQKDALVVPLDSVITIQNLHQLAVVGPDNKVSIRNVNVSFMTREEAVIISGVSKGEKIVVQGIQKVTDGCTVTPLPAAATTSTPPPVPEQGASITIPAASSANPQSSAGAAAKK